MYKLHIDAGHGWLAVKRDELKRLDILDSISRCSYEKGKTVYLEEDCDMTKFLDAKEKAGEDVRIQESYKDRSPVRSYPQFAL